MQNFMADFAMLLLGLISALLILVVLLQRGRGGGLAGAFGGLGGQSAFGTKAGDVFTKITIGLVTVWVLLAGISGVMARKASSKFVEDPAADKAPDVPGGGAGSMTSTGDGTGLSETSDTDSTDGTLGDDTSPKSIDGVEGSKPAEPDSADKPDGTPSDPEPSGSAEPALNAPETKEPKTSTPEDSDAASSSIKPAGTAAESSTPAAKPTTAEKKE
ncbi:MAG: preprotein translocase subunit SecG [Planctomycetota bacterium]|nr:preprotein translocase subunit SecG [Planctomycetota bacterium]MDA1163035.1 preprotein translocase subunit SecG [Planctomycetota bacterium]